MGLTFNQHLNAALAIAEDRRRDASANSSQAEARDLSVSITAIEDALTRYNSSRYRSKGTWQRADPDA